MIQEKGRLYGVGVGPGDAKLITIKAVEVIKSADFIAIADSGSENTALSIVKEYAAGKPVIACPMPMIRDEKKLADAHNKSALIIKNILDGGKNVAFITLGDPTVYSTYIYVHNIIKKDGYDTQIIPGVTSFCAAAALMGVSLCDKGEALTIIPASYDGYEKYLETKGTKVLMKSGKNFDNIRNELIEKGLANNAFMVEKCGMKGEKVFTNLSDAPKDSGYFSVVVVK